MSKKRALAQKYFSILGLNIDENSLTVNEYNSVTYSRDNRTFSAGATILSIKLASLPLNIDSTDDEIIKTFKSDNYLSALATLAGISLDDAYIHREDIGSLKELRNDDNSNEGSVSRTFRVCAKSDSPADLAFNLANASIIFTFTESTEEKSESEAFIRASCVSTKDIKTAEQLISFSDAKAQADAMVVNPNPETDKLTDKENVPCRIVYDDTVKDTYSIPCYRFYYTTEQKTEISVDIPCIDISTLN